MARYTEEVQRVRANIVKRKGRQFDPDIEQFATNENGLDIEFRHFHEGGFDDPATVNAFNAEVTYNHLKAAELVHDLNGQNRRFFDGPEAGEFFCTFKYKVKFIISCFFTNSKHTDRFNVSATRTCRINFEIEEHEKPVKANFLWRKLLSYVTENHPYQGHDYLLFDQVTGTL